MSKFVSLLLGVVLLASCSDKIDDDVLTSTALPMAGTQAVPAKPVAGTGTIDAFYNRTTKTLYYTVKWNSLTGAPATGFGIYGPAAPGFNNANKQAFSTTGLTAAGTYTGTVFIDGTVLKEEELLMGEYYVMIPTATYAATAGGEIRGQIKFVQ
ncbi:MAG TPA: CHRD domain-containing protein [Chitinophagaceae bacterium]|nr:CHRD domain-containing protein [Chitinophagaceae bacterium]